MDILLVRWPWYDRVATSIYIPIEVTVLDCTVNARVTVKFGKSLGMQ